MLLVAKNIISSDDIIKEDRRSMTVSSVLIKLKEAELSREENSLYIGVVVSHWFKSHSQPHLGGNC